MNFSNFEKYVSISAAIFNDERHSSVQKWEVFCWSYFCLKSNKVGGNIKLISRKISHCEENSVEIY